jgi:hypothetical protein
MNTQVRQSKKDCEICFKIKCKNCGWEPDEAELEEVMTGKLNICPGCGFAK